MGKEEEGRGGEEAIWAEEAQVGPVLANFPPCLGPGEKGVGEKEVWAAGKKQHWGCNSFSHRHFRRTGSAEFPWPHGSP